MEALNEFSEKVYSNLTDRLNGQISTVVDIYSDSIEFIINDFNRPFHFKLYNVQDRIYNGESSENIANMITSVYKKHILGIYFKPFKTENTK